MLAEAIFAELGAEELSVGCWPAAVETPRANADVTSTSRNALCVERWKAKLVVHAEGKKYTNVLRIGK